MRPSRIPRTPLLKVLKDDIELSRKVNGKLDKFDKAVLTYFLFVVHNAKFNSIKQGLYMHDSFFDLDKTQIASLKGSLPLLRDMSFNLSNRELLRACELHGITYDAKSSSARRLIENSLQIAAKHIVQLLSTYETVIQSKDLEDSEKFIREIIKEFDETARMVKEGKATPEAFEKLAADYGCNASGNVGFEQFNSFLRENSFKDTDPRTYAWMFNKINSLRKALLGNSVPINEGINKKPLTLYRHTNLIGLVGVLKDSMLVPKNFEEKFTEKYSKILEQRCEAEISERKKKIEQLKKQVDNKKTDNPFDPIKAEISILEREIEGYERRLGEDFDVYTNYDEDFRAAFTKELDNILDKKPYIHDKAFWSTSASEKAAAGFGNEKFVIKCKAGTVKAGDISSYSGHPNQFEHLFVPGAIFKVTAYKHDAMLNYTITLETDTKKS